MARRLTTEEFIERARAVHGDRFGYELVEYVNNTTPILIVCPIHGVFEQRPDSHLHSKKCCPKCSGVRKKTTEEFIEEARRVHGDKYIYDVTCYSASNKKLLVHCPLHGIFEQLASKHLLGSGCPECARERQAMDTEEFIIRGQALYGAKYTYDKTFYYNNHTKLCVTCDIHGDFYVTPGNFLNGHGCPKCGIESRADKQRTSLEEFLLQARQQHSDKYDYSRIDSINNMTRAIPIICPIHGLFYQTPSVHIRGSGCPQCGIEKAASTRRHTTDDFIESARAIHGTKYEYGESQYVSSVIPLAIRCKKHGIFYQTPSAHLSGNGCPKCKADIVSEVHKLTTEEFIARAKAIHGEKFIYSHINYQGTLIPVEVICAKHGSFYITPHKHLCGQGCPICSKEESTRKMIATRKRNGTLSTSGSEQQFLEMLYDKFGEENVEYQYKSDPRYPFNCDFYVSSLDLFIELNASQFHNRHWFDENDPNDLAQLKIFEEKATRSENSQYKEIIYTWTVRDPLKRKTAEDNNLNYLVFWDNDLADAKAWLETQ